MTSLGNLNAEYLRDKKVLLRVDLNVPINNGKLLDDSRLKAFAETLSFLRKEGAKIILLSHRGQPGHDACLQNNDSNFSLGAILPFLHKCYPDLRFKLYGKIDDLVQTNPSSLDDIMVLENLRFDPNETNKNEHLRKNLAQKLARLADVYVNDAFSVSHRNHASITNLPEFLPAYIGFACAREIREINRLKDLPAQGRVALLGGSKVSSKLGFIKSLIPTCEYLLLGGGIANTFQAAQGVDIGDSLCEHNMKGEALALSQLARRQGCQIILPQDVVGCPHGDHGKVQASAIYDSQNIPPGFKIFDLGPKTLEAYKNIILSSKNFLWNGPVGFFENPPFDKGSLYLAKALSTYHGSSLVGGGETLAVLRKARMQHHVSFASNGGGAFLDFYVNGTLPGLVALQESCLDKPKLSFIKDV